MDPNQKEEYENDEEKYIVANYDTLKR